MQIIYLMQSVMKNCQSGDIAFLKNVAEKESLDAHKIAKSILSGRAVLLQNEKRSVEPCLIGEGARIKVNVNIGTSGVTCHPEKEMEKARAAIDNGADTLMDLSTGGDLKQIRSEILKLAVPVGTVPVYEAVRRAGNVLDVTADILFDTIRDQAKEGVDFMTLHCGVTRETLAALKLDPRVTGVVSRGGSFHTAMMLASGAENPLYKEFDYLLEILDEYGVVLSLGDGMRPGAYVDSVKLAKSQEYLTLGHLARRAYNAGVQRMIEGPGHMDYAEISYNVKMIKEITGFAPLYLLGPLVTDIAPGYDHITGAIGGALAACSGADFLCMVSPSEHLALPNLADIVEGTRVCKVAAHVGDLERRKDLERAREEQMAFARKNLDWDAQFRLALFGGHAREVHERDGECKTCSMCGDLCALKMVEKALGGGKREV